MLIDFISGSDCSVMSQYGLWTTFDIDSTVGGRASAAVAQINSQLYITGGYSLNKGLPFLAR